MNLDFLQLAVKSAIPLVYIRTDDLVNIEEVLSFIAGDKVRPLNIPEVIAKVSDLKVPEGKLHFTTGECKSMVKLYHFATMNELTIIFVNTERSILQVDCGNVLPPKEMVINFLSGISQNPLELLPAYGGLTLKDVNEISKMTMTRDEELSVRGINKTRGCYSNLRGITQVDTAMSYYKVPTYLHDWLGTNTQFFMDPVHDSLTPRGLLFDGPPGTGKSAAAKHIAATFGLPLYRLDIGAMKGKYVGDSEGNLLAALSQVDQIEPCVVIFDEVEKVFQSTGDSGVTSSMLSQLLWWLQEHRTRVFSVMTTNDKDAIPKELYREGRIDGVMEFLGIQGSESGFEFALGAMTSMAKELGGSIEGDSTSELKDRIKLLYMDANTVPQVKLTQVAYNLIREMLSNAEEA